MTITVAVVMAIALVILFERYSNLNERLKQLDKDIYRDFKFSSQRIDERIRKLEQKENLCDSSAVLP